MIRGVCGHVWEAKATSAVILELNLDKHEDIFALPQSSSSSSASRSRRSQQHQQQLAEAPIVARISVSAPSLDEMPASVELWQTHGTDEQSMAERFRILPRVSVFHNTMTVVALLHRHFTHLVVGMAGNVKKALPTSPCKHNVIVCVEPALSDGHGGEPLLHPLAVRAPPGGAADGSSPQAASPPGALSPILRSGSAAAAPSYPQPQNVVSAPSRGYQQRDADESIFYYSGRGGNRQDRNDVYDAANSRNTSNNNHVDADDNDDISQAYGVKIVRRAQQLEPIYPPQAAQAMKSSRYFHRPGTEAGGDSEPQPRRPVPATSSSAVLPRPVAPSESAAQPPSKTAQQQQHQRQHEDVHALHMRRLDASSRQQQELRRVAAQEAEDEATVAAGAPAGKGRFLSPPVPFELQFRLPGDPKPPAAAPAPASTAATPAKKAPVRVIKEEQTQTSRSGSPPPPLLPPASTVQQQVVAAPELSQLQLQQLLAAASAGKRLPLPPSPPPPPPPPPIAEADAGRTSSPFSNALSVQELLAVVCQRMADWTESVEDLAVVYSSRQQRLFHASALAVRNGGGVGATTTVFVAAVSPRRSVAI